MKQIESIAQKPSTNKWNVFKHDLDKMRNRDKSDTDRSKSIDISDGMYMRMNRASLFTKHLQMDPNKMY